MTGEPNKLPQAGCCWGEDGSWGSDKEREGCSIQYCGQAPCDGQDVRDAKNTHWTQHPLYAMAALWWPVLFLAYDLDQMMRRNGMHKVKRPLYNDPPQIRDPLQDTVPEDLIPSAVSVEGIAQNSGGPGLAPSAERRP